ncbi:MAG: SGNH/GDSL hydrolase family protein, partial [Paracoccaceae bacterium]|nr:SGNH/GDSL hydrolase family protein [Paracoccaceae bacterium]
MRLSILLLAGCLAATAGLHSARAEAPGAPDVLILGDSQLTFGAGKAFVALLSDMAGSCGLDPDTTTGVIGVRSSAITSWTGRTKRA